MQEASGAAGIEEFTKAAKANGLTILDTVEYQTRTADFAPIVAKIRGLNPQAVFSCSLVPTTLPLVKEMETQGFDKPLLDCGLVGAGNFIHAVGSAGKIVHSMGFATNEPDASNDGSRALCRGLPQAFVGDDQAAAAGQCLEHQSRL